MISITSGNILEADAEALVNTVNCAGFMGKGIALQFKKAHPDNFKAYSKACKADGVKPGHMFIFQTSELGNPKFIINFPTKRHWKGRSRYEDVEAGLTALARDVLQLGIQSVAIPPLGCGLGGLSWQRVRPMIEDAFAEAPGIQVLLFEPLGAPDAKKMPVGTERPKLTVARALFIKLIQQYTVLAYRLTLLEIQKLAYFLQEAGQPMRLIYVQHIYGPYAHNLNKMLELLEGHYTRGYGDSQKPDVDIELLPDAVEEATVFLEKHAAEHKRLSRVAELITGFETPYGMELLASVHWLAVHAERPARTKDEAVSAMAEWNERKRKMFWPKHIGVAWERLAHGGWLGTTKN